jgi:hypothetical protein
MSSPAPFSVQRAILNSANAVQYAGLPTTGNAGNGVELVGGDGAQAIVWAAAVSGGESKKQKNPGFAGVLSAPCRTRTYNPLIKSQML